VLSRRFWLQCRLIGHSLTFQNMTLDVVFMVVVVRFGASLSVSDLDIDAEWGLVWVVDVEGRVRFTTGVSAVQPHGTGCWWQVACYSTCSMFL